MKYPGTVLFSYRDDFNADKRIYNILDKKERWLKRTDGNNLQKGLKKPKNHSIIYPVFRNELKKFA